MNSQTRGILDFVFALWFTVMAIGSAIDGLWILLFVSVVLLIVRVASYFGRRRRLR